MFNAITAPAQCPANFDVLKTLKSAPHPNLPLDMLLGESAMYVWNESWIHCEHTFKKQIADKLRNWLDSLFILSLTDAPKKYLISRFGKISHSNIFCTILALRPSRARSSVTPKDPAWLRWSCIALLPAPESLINWFAFSIQRWTSEFQQHSKSQNL